MLFILKQALMTRKMRFFMILHIFAFVCSKQFIELRTKFFMSFFNQFIIGIVYFFQMNWCTDDRIDVMSHRDHAEIVLQKSTTIVNVIVRASAVAILVWFWPFLTTFSPNEMAATSDSPVSNATRANPQWILPQQIDIYLGMHNESRKSEY